MSAKKENLKRKLKGVYNLLSKLRVFTLILTALPGGLISFAGIMPNLRFFENFYIVDGDAKYLKTWVCVLLFILCLLGFITSLIWTIFSKDDYYNEQKRMNIYKTLKEAESIYGKRYHDTFFDVINEKKYADKVEKALESVIDNSSRLNPEFRLKNMMLSIKDVLCKVYGLAPNELSINLIHKKFGEDKWRLLAAYNTKDNEKTIKQLMNNPQSTYSAVLKAPSKQILCISKEEGKNKSIYTPTPEEEERGIAGSVYCRNLSIYNEDDVLERGFLFSVSTYNKEFGDPHDSYVINVCLELFDDIINFIKPEIATICLNENINVEGYLNAKTSETTTVKLEEGFGEKLKNVFHKKT